MVEDAAVPAQAAVSKPSAKEAARQFRALQDEADGYAANGDWGAQAEALNLKLLALDAGYTVGMARLARCLIVRGEPSEAEAIYIRMLEVEPGNVIATNFLRRVTQAKDLVLLKEKLAAQAARKEATARRAAAKLSV